MEGGDEKIQGGKEGGAEDKASHAPTCANSRTQDMDPGKIQLPAVQNANMSGKVRGMTCSALKMETVHISALKGK